MTDRQFTNKDLKILNSKEGILDLLRFDKLNFSKTIEYQQVRNQLKKLQIDLLKMQDWVIRKKYRLAIIFEGRDLAGKGGCIRWFIEHLNPRSYRSVALPIPTEVEQGQWYFQRYINLLPNPGEIVFFDRSWYNRAIVEPVNGFCTNKQYKLFMRQVPEFELMLAEDGIQIIKFWLSVSKEEQKKRLLAVKKNPLASWKLSGLDKKAQNLWDDYSRYKLKMLKKTNLPFNPWVILDSNYVPPARVESIKYVLSQVPYPKSDATKKLLVTDSTIISIQK